MNLFNPNTGNSAEDQMSKAFGCVAVTIIGFVALVIVGIALLVKAVL